MLESFSILTIERAHRIPSWFVHAYDKKYVSFFLGLVVRVSSTVQGLE